MPIPDQVWLESYRPGLEGRSFCFFQPQDEILVASKHQMEAALSRVEEVVRSGAHAVVALPYDLAPVFDPALSVAGRNAEPAATGWIGLYGQRREVAPGQAASDATAFSIDHWQPSITQPAYVRKVEEIRDYIAAGDAYQVNFTFPMEADFSGDPVGLYRAICRGQGSAAFCAFIDFGDRAILSASPELFFALGADGTLRTRPMKGTRRRGRGSVEDDHLRRQLRESAKDRAENVMIVDLLRNDLGRVAVAGSIVVDSLYDVEAYDTVWQMTSTVTGRAREEVGLYELFSALFPCGSVTGAPKVRATQIIEELEHSPRGIYTGTIGYVSAAEKIDKRRLSGLEAVFSVAIRTVTVDRDSRRAIASVGSAITWDSEASAEYEECRDKLRFLLASSLPDSAVGAQEYELFETLLFEPETGYYLVDRHLKRLQASARYFDFSWDGALVREQLESLAVGERSTCRVRLRLARDGKVQSERAAIGSLPEKLTAIVAQVRVDSEDPFLYHKTTRRHAQTAALARAREAGVDEVILCNERGELTECSIGNLVVQREGRRITPELACGLLPGTFREHLLELGQIEEGILLEADLREAESIYMINSVRRWVSLSVSGIKIN